MRRAEEAGTLSIVLHGHLPWVHHPLEPDFLEEDWFFHAVLECYLPLLDVLERLAEEEIPVRLTVGLTPVLLETLRAPTLREKLARFLERREELFAREARALQHSPALAHAAEHLHGRASEMRARFEAWGGDLLPVFRRLQDEGHLEIMASSATHAVLPLLGSDAARRAQIRLGCALHAEVFGRPPRGFWLPECAYTPGLEALLAEEGVRWTVMETHAICGATPRPPAGICRPIRLPEGPLAFGRDPRASELVWSSDVGYPGDPHYREYHRDGGFDAPYDRIRPYLHDDGIRRELGLKLHRVTGDVPLGEKAPYEPEVALDRARQHAEHFLRGREAEVATLRHLHGFTSALCAPYDLELFGHWWYEGPAFLEALFRRAAAHPSPLRLATPEEVVADAPAVPTAQPPLSTWGEGGSLAVWLEDRNHWLLDPTREVELRMAEAVAAHPVPTAEQRRLLEQMGREALLAQSSDWAFILSRETAAWYAKKRFCDHVDRFLACERALAGAPLEGVLAHRMLAEDCLFPGLDHRLFAGGPATREGTRLGLAPSSGTLP